MTNIATPAAQRNAAGDSTQHGADGDSQFRDARLGAQRETSPADESLAQEWVDSYGLSRAQALAMIHQVRTVPEAVVERPRGQHRVQTVLVEALGYLGGAVIVVAVALIVAQMWQEIPIWVRFTVPLIGAIALVLTGFAVPAQRVRAADRLQSVVWAAGCAALAGAGAVFGSDIVGWQDESVVLAAAVPVALLAAGLWWHKQCGVQQAVLFVALAFVVVAVGSLLGGTDEPVASREQMGLGEVLPGLLLWALALTWLALGLRGRLAPARVATLLGAAGLVFGALMVGPIDWLMAVALVVVVGIVALAVWQRDFLLLIVGTAGVLAVLPPLVARFFPNAVAAAVVLLGVGAALVVLAVIMARRGGRASARLSVEGGSGAAYPSE